MKTTDKELRERAQALSPDFASQILFHKGETATVKSSTTDQTYTVRIHRISDTNLDATCSCPAHKICHHITAYYAMVKGITPEGFTEEKETPPQVMTGQQMIASAIEMLVDGIALVVRENKEE